ncbi:kinase-associated lipoprotein B [Jeotgalibacillus haloalkalitolerans]|uniref:Kinase-associated lipoprotein B n=1 Tax=Jeotgalibacillus haloalkalitolerans TaxID=3104292 RepID=A0ABU5KQW5_9BACL|nr:kinase-associated lipoprotein B [Jeotgalibacillus sp. HH7-29]MDZ5713646.1 kinase-associated lipoprotein B [Jeotgalibacillus sp. HH7-29]
MNLVKAFYKTGAYVGEVDQVHTEHQVIRIKSVIKHPEQGDLHNPKQVDVPFFHERKALALNERANIPSSMVKPFDGELTDYNESLIQSVQKLEEKLKAEDSPYNQKCLEALQGVKREYELMYNLTF